MLFRSELEDLEKNKKQLQRTYEEKLLNFYNEQSKKLENEMRLWKESQHKKEDFTKIRKTIDEQRIQIEQKLIEKVKKTWLSVKYQALT